MLHDGVPAKYADQLRMARERAAGIASSAVHQEFVERVRSRAPRRFSDAMPPEHFARGVDHHLDHFIPRLLRSVDLAPHEVFDFGCGTGSSAVALAMVFPESRCYGTDINRADVAIARERAKLYGVADRCRFDAIGKDEGLPAASDRFDLCICCSVLEYVIDPTVREHCVREMARITAPGGMLFVTVPNRIHPVEIHKRKLGWNYFPKLLKAQVVGSSAWEVRRLARPYLLKLHRTPWLQLITPWSSFCLRKDG